MDDVIIAAPGETGLAGELVVQLLDPTYHHAIRTWKFVDRSQISIGRANEADIEISDPYVSRIHAELMASEEGWVLIARGRNGVYVNERPITELLLLDALTFRLGAAGPHLRLSAVEPTEPTPGTLSYSTEDSPLLQLDETKLREDVAHVAEDEYFQKLQQQVRQLRQGRDGHPTAET